MALGPGKYDSILTDALIKCGANQGFFMVFDGEYGPSFCCQLNQDMVRVVPNILRNIAKQIEQDESKL